MILNSVHLNHLIRICWLNMIKHWCNNGLSKWRVVKRWVELKRGVGQVVVRVLWRVVSVASQPKYMYVQLAFFTAHHYSHPVTIVFSRHSRTFTAFSVCRLHLNQCQQHKLLAGMLTNMGTNIPFLSVKGLFLYKPWH